MITFRCLVTIKPLKILPQKHGYLSCRHRHQTTIHRPLSLHEIPPGTLMQHRSVAIVETNRLHHAAAWPSGAAAERRCRIDGGRV